MRGANIVGLTAAAMICFAANSVLCRLALAAPLIDPASFTALRLLAGAAVLAALTAWRAGGSLRSLATAGDWRSATALFVYAAAFSFAYVNLDAGAGALILFGFVQATMIGYGLWRGERLSLMQSIGATLAAAGLVYLLAPGLSAPPLAGAALMAIAGAAWGVYSLFGRDPRNQRHDTTTVTAGNFLRAAPMGLVLLAPFAGALGLSVEGAALAIASGALASGGGYAIWYAALKGLNASEAAVVQLTVPVLAAFGGVAFIGESLSLRFVLAAAAILGGVALVLTLRARKAAA